MIHGGDIYKNRIELDFSVNTNPYPMPIEIKVAMQLALDRVDTYPEYDYKTLRNAIAKLENYGPEGIVCGNGASEIFMALVNAIRPRKAALFVPSFYGYEHCLKSVDSEISYIDMKESDERILNSLSEDIDMVFLGNPNNPTGKYWDESLLEIIMKRCRDKNICLVLDECFYDLGVNGKRRDLYSFFEAYPNVIIVKAFTKLFAVPGLRIAYGLTAFSERENLLRKLPEWNVSVIADAVGQTCCRLLMDTDFLEQTHKLLETEKNYLARELGQLGFNLYESDCNFLLLKTEYDLKKDLLEKGILIRDCSNFRGLSKGYYRIAIKDRASNEKLIDTIKGLYND